MIIHCGSEPNINKGSREFCFFCSIETASEPIVLRYAVMHHGRRYRLNSQQAISTSHLPRDIFIVLQSIGTSQVTVHLVKGSLKITNMNYGLTVVSPRCHDLLSALGNLQLNFPHPCNGHTRGTDSTNENYCFTLHESCEPS